MGLNTHGLVRFVTLSALALKAMAAGAVLTVGPGEDHESIAAAVAAAGPDDIIDVVAGTFEEAVLIDKALTIRGANDGVSAGSVPGTRAAETILKGGLHILPSASGSVISGLRVEQGFEDGGVKHGLLIDAPDVLVRDAIITGVGVFPAAVPGSHGVSLTANADGVRVERSRITANTIGLHASGAENTHLAVNQVDANGGDGVVFHDASGIVLEGNRIEAQVGAGVRSTGTSAGLEMRDNLLIGNGLAVANDAPAGVDAARNFWDSGGNPPQEGGSNGYSGDVDFSPWFADASLQTLVEGVFTDLVVSEGETLAAEVLVVADGATLTVDRGDVVVDRLDLQGGGILEVIDGDLEMGVPSGGTHTIAGTFRIIHSLGSIEILADTTFSGNTLALVSDFDIADGVDLTITGSLVLDGCRLTSPGSFGMVLNGGATLEMTRCEVRGGSLFLVGSDLRLVDNLFYDSTGFVFGTVQGAEVFHNVFFGGLGQFSILPGATVTTDVEGWGNVETLADARNRLLLEWMAPTLPGRTLDTADGTLYVQPGDPVRVEVDSGGFTERIQAAEMLLAYHSGYVSLTGYTPRSPWDHSLYLLDQPLTLFGKVDAAAGFGFAFEDPDGTLEDHVIGDFSFDTTSQEGRTLMFFREKEASDDPMIDTRLTASSGGNPSYLDFPFTRNSGTLVIDGTLPLIDEPGATVTQDLGAGAMDLLMTGVITRIGTIEISFAAYDDLAGVDPADVAVTLVGPTTLDSTLAATTEQSVGGLPYTGYAFQQTVDATTPDGLYEVYATVTDRSGNTSQVLLGTLEIAKLIAVVNVGSEGLTTDPITRDVTFVMTDAGGQVLETRTAAVDFLGGTGSAVLAGLPSGTGNISAKTAWTQRRRLPCVFDAAGDAAVDFTGAWQLPGGDLNGDNIINLIDYNILNADWFTTSSAADISGEGVVNVLDFNILNSNWFTAGDPP